MKLSVPSALALGAVAFACDAALAQTNFASTYNGATTAGTTCSSTFNISGAEPSGTGPFPVFIYLVGTVETYNNATAMAQVNAMAAKGYVAATVEYADDQFGNCSVLSGKSKCVFDPNSTVSAVAQICSRAKADCSKGIVVGGFSQGSILALLAKNFDARIEAVYGTGMSNVYSSYDLSSCVSDGNRALKSDRLRAVVGERDNYAGGIQANVQATLQNLTGKTCVAGSYSCLNANSSGWLIVKNSDLRDGSADHCYTRASGDCFGSQSSLDSNWDGGTASWAKDPNLQWLTGFTTK